jgi:hypothetical protein
MIGVASSMPWAFAHDVIARSCSSSEIVFSLVRDGRMCGDQRAVAILRCHDDA